MFVNCSLKSIDQTRHLLLKQFTLAAYFHCNSQVYNRNVRHRTSLQETDGHSIAEDVKAALELKHNYEEHVLAQQTDQTLPA